MQRSSLARGSFVRLGTTALALVPVVARAGMPDESLRDLGGERVARIDVVHLPQSISTRARLTPADLEALPDARRLTIEGDAIAVIVGEARGIVVQPPPGSAGGYDCRWSLRFMGAAGVLTLTSDGFGRAGAIDGRPVVLQAAAFLSSLERRYSTLR